MPRTSIPITEIGLNGSLNPIVWTAADSTNDMMFDNDGRTVLLIRNASAGAVNVTVKSVADEAGRTGDIVMAVAAGNTSAVSPLRPAWWNQRSGDIGKVHVDFDVATSITVAALRLNP